MKKLLLLFIALFLSAVDANAANRFAVCVTTCTWDNSSTAMWSASSGGATGASFPIAGDNTIFDGATCVGGTTCTITVSANLHVASINMGACTASTTGCILDFSANNNNITFDSDFTNSGTGLRRLNMGNGIWTMPTTTGTLWNITTATNLTLNANGSTILFPTSNNSRTFATIDNLVYNTVQINTSLGASSPLFTFSIGAFTITNFIVGASMGIRFTGGVPTFTNITITGTSSGIVFIDGQLRSPVVTGTGAMNWAAIRDAAFNGAGTPILDTNGINLGNVTGITFTGGSSTACILGGWLLWRDMPGNLNDNFPAWLDKAA